jgi:hypothetical protein
MPADVKTKLESHPKGLKITSRWRRLAALDIEPEFGPAAVRETRLQERDQKLTIFIEGQGAQGELVAGERANTTSFKPMHAM